MGNSQMEKPHTMSCVMIAERQPICILRQKKQSKHGTGGQKMTTEKRIVYLEHVNSDLRELLEAAKACSDSDDLMLMVAACTDTIIKHLEKFPTVDAVEVIRCHNCQYSEPCKVRGKVWCTEMGKYMKQDGFCSEGVMKDA
jgi:hypothetical protein